MGSSINLVDLGRRIRAARLARRLTLEDVVSQTDFTASWLSKLENGLLAPSLKGLVRLSEVLECGIDTLVAGLCAPPKCVVTRNGAGQSDNVKGNGSGLTVERLAAAWWGRAIEPDIIHLSGSGNRKAPHSYEGDRFLHVLEGEVKVTYGDELIVLGPGDSAYLDAAIPHWFAPADRGAARVLSVSFDRSLNGRSQPAGKGPNKSRARATTA